MNIPDPPLHMRPGTPEFIQWVINAQQYAEFAVESASSWDVTYSILTYGTSISVTGTEQTILTVNIAWQVPGNLFIEYYAGASVPTYDYVDVAIRLKRDGVEIDSLHLYQLVYSYKGFIYLEAATDEEVHTYTVTATRSGSISTTIDTGGIMVQRV